MAKAFCAVCHERWYYFEPGVKEITKWRDEQGKPVKKTLHYHKECYPKRNEH